MEKETISKVAAWAKVMVEDVDIEYRDQAFQVVFDKLLDETITSDMDVSLTAKTKRRGKIADEPQNKLELVLSSQLDYSSYSEIIHEGDYAEKSLMILRVVEESLGIRSLTATELAEIMEKQLRIPNVYRTNVSRALLNAKDYFIRNKEGRSFNYMVSVKGEQHLESIK